MQLSRVSLLICAVAFLCCNTFSTEAGPHEDCGCAYTLRPPLMGFFAFMDAADRMVASKAPEWYVVGSEEQPLIMHAMPNLKNIFGQAWKDEEGVYNISFGRSALFLATIEDAANVMLHEYVHLKIWDEIASHDEWTTECKEARHELVANKVVIESYHKLGYTPHMYRHAKSLYGEARAEAKIAECPEAITIDMPHIPIQDIPFDNTFPIFKPPKDSSSESN